MENEKTNCEELKELLISKINEISCDGKSRDKNENLLKILMSDEITRSEFYRQVTQGLAFADYIPSSFKINNLDAIMKQEVRQQKYLHIYFAIKNDAVTLLFWFNNNLENPNNDFSNEKLAYLLEDDELIFNEADIINYKNYIKAFDDYYLKTANYKDITIYITYPMEKILKNFKKFSPCVYVRSGKNDGTRNRLNLVMEVLKADCATATFSTGIFTHFDMGDLRP